MTPSAFPLRTRSFALLSFALLLGCSSGGTSSDAAEGGAGSEALDPLTPPSNPERMLEWKTAFVEEGWEALWVCEEEPKSRTLPGSSAHAQPTRICSNPLLAAQTLEAGEELPRGVAALKFLASGGFYVEVKVADASAGGDGWIWSSPGGGGIQGWGTCTGCHGDAEPGADTLGDYVYVRVPAE